MNVKRLKNSISALMHDKNFVKPISIKYALEKFSVKIQLQIQYSEKKSREITFCFLNCKKRFENFSVKIQHLSQNRYS